MTQEKKEPVHVVIAGFGDIVHPNWLNSNEELKRLNSNLEEASAASDRLTISLNHITFAGVIIAALGLGLEFYKLICN